MRMTIEEAIRRIDEHNYIHQRKEPRAVYITEALDMAIDTMRKYQKIKNIICKWEDGLYDDEGVSHVEILDMISNEVNGDGNDN